ncbi:hypothetical protein PINS_up005281 [Pythium insidiosum]|nr:hypothetical protein PINS_up005281 [Pythium insidiosum]
MTDFFIGIESPHGKDANAAPNNSNSNSNNFNANNNTNTNTTTASSFLSAHGGARDDALDQCSIHLPILGTPVPADANGAHGAAAARTGDASLTQPPMLERRTSDFLYPQKGARSRRRGATAPDDASSDMGPPLLGLEPRVPRCFLPYPFYNNSFFARRLLRVSASLTVVMMLGVGVYYGYRPKSLVLNPDFPDDYGFMLRSPEEVYLLMASSCENMVGFSALVYHAFPAIMLLGLPGTGLRLFEPFKREPLIDAAGNRQKVKRTFMFQFCEAIGVWLLLFALLVMMYFWYMFFNGGTFKCVKPEVHVFAAGAVLCYIAIFVVLSYFARYREHIKMQLGAFKESDQTGDVRKHLVDPATAELMTKRNKVISHIRKRLYQAARLGDIGELRDVLSFAESRQSALPGFPMKYYRDPSIFLGVFGHSRKNPVHVAAYHGNIEALELLLGAGFEVNALDKFSRVRFSTGDLFWYFAQFFISRPAVSDEENAVSVFKTTLVTPLHCAVSTGQLEAVRWLLAHGAEVGSTAKSSYRSERIPPIFLAETPEVVRELLEHGANHLAIPDPGFMNTLTVLQLAYLRENHAVAHELEEWGCDVALTPIHAAAARNDTATVRKYIRRGTSVNCLGEHGYCGMNRRTPLHWAAVIGATETVDLLLEAGADPDFQDARGRTPLHWAARLNHLDIVRSLLAKNASPNVVDEDHMTPIVCAAFARRATRELFNELVTAGGDINYQLPTNGDTAFHIAVREENEEAALSILASGGNIMKMNIEGLRPLDCSTNTKLLFEIKRAAGHRDVMISYTHTHAEFAKKLRRSLEDANVTTWLDLMDPSGIGGGAVWREEIARGITNAALVVCILTEDYAQSEWCLKELALAKQVGTPILAVSTEGVRLGEELQVYLYTRQIIPFEPCITETTRNVDNPRQIEYLYDDAKFRSQFRLLLDGVRDEIEKRRNASISKNTDKGATVEASIVANSVVGISKMFQMWDAPDSQFVFISHGDRNSNFVTRLYKELGARNIAYYGDRNVGNDQQGFEERIHRAKEAILKCTCFVVVLSKETMQNELVRDQLAFAEDKGRPIFPIVLNDLTIGDDKRYSLARTTFFHFLGDGFGFQGSFDALFTSLTRHYDMEKQQRLQQQEELVQNRRVGIGHGSALVTNSSSSFVSNSSFVSFLHNTGPGGADTVSSGSFISFGPNDAAQPAVTPLVSQLTPYVIAEHSEGVEIVTPEIPPAPQRSPADDHGALRLSALGRSSQGIADRGDSIRNLESISSMESEERSRLDLVRM